MGLAYWTVKKDVGSTQCGTAAWKGCRECVSRRAGLIDRRLPEDCRRLAFLGPLRVWAGAGALVEM